MRAEYVFVYNLIIVEFLSNYFYAIKNRLLDSFFVV